MDRKDEWMAMLSQDPWFASLRPEMVELLLSAATERRHAARTIVYGMNEAPDGIYAVLCGRVRLSEYTVDGRHILSGAFGRGVWFGVVSEFDGLPRPHTATAAEPTRLLHVPSAAVRDIMSRDWRNCYDMGRCVAGLYRRTLRVLSNHRKLDYPTRVAQTLLAMSDHEIVMRSAGMERRVTQEDLAASAGVTRQSINRLLNEWEERGLIERGYRHVKLVNPEGLAAIAADES